MMPQPADDTSTRDTSTHEYRLRVFESRLLLLVVDTRTADSTAGPSWNEPPVIDVDALNHDDEVNFCGRKHERERRAQQKAMERLQRRSSKNRKRR